MYKRIKVSRSWLNNCRVLILVKMCNESYRFWRQKSIENSPASVMRYGHCSPHTYRQHVTQLAGRTKPIQWHCVCDDTRLKRDGTRAETRFGLSAQRTSPFKLPGVGEGGQLSRLLAAEMCASEVVMLDTPCSEVEFPLHFPYRASPCAITFQLSYILRRHV